MASGYWSEKVRDPVVSKCEAERDDHSMCTGLNRMEIRWNVDRGNRV